MCEKFFRQCQQHSKSSVRDRDYYNALIYEDDKIGDDDDDCYKAYVYDQFVLISHSKDLSSTMKNI